MSKEHWNQQKSKTNRYGITKYEDYIESCFTELGLPCKRRQVFCFICLNMWENETDRYPEDCRICGTRYLEARMYCMPDIVVEDPERHGKAVIFINGEHHNKKQVKEKDKYQIQVLKKNNWRVFTIWNEELDLLRHANRCFLVLGMYRAMKDLTMYVRAFDKEKESLH